MNTENYIENGVYLKRIENILNTSANDLFQIRKIGVRLVIPPNIRQSLIDSCGDDAIRWLRMIDGNVNLKFATSDLTELKNISTESGENILQNANESLNLFRFSPNLFNEANVHHTVVIARAGGGSAFYLDTVGQRIRNVRADNDIETFSSLLDVQSVDIQDIEADIKPPSAELLIKLNMLCGVDPSWLLTGKCISPPESKENRSCILNTAALSGLFIFISRIAKAIRMNSSYSEIDLRSNSQSSNDVMWLSDALHNLDMLSDGLMDEKTLPHKIDKLKQTFIAYLGNKDTLKSQPMETFNRWDIDIEEGIKLLDNLTK